MLQQMLAGGSLVVVLLGCSVLALAIVLERLWALRSQAVTPRGLVDRVLARQITLSELHKGSPLGRVLVAGLMRRRHGVVAMREAMQSAGAQEVHQLERFLNALGTVATIAPLLGLLGTVVGMIEVFQQLNLGGAGQPQQLAGGIAKALVTTAAGLAVAIPSVIMHRFLLRRVSDNVVVLEGEAQRLLERLGVPAPARELELGENTDEIPTGDHNWE
ncbi:hypothetical protein BFW38_04815 [Terasakiispira papahanaumokuakeensis]|uniref:MotA/TolQ/ExbB proton channel domain-containing protein n=1 Tax=Terasakiispira papahanaumokuakeensis TaxID=197479 RepID=A0A1E2V7I0_9GAMM|nr:MotA/TolQ/ExbB proton channel family protein [Terasakiispira papahanaumokuakeensis]ODC02970.1 hypothetical protein BFW38_04815 [Terasakiispira papahanaumokuakeensis]